MIRKLLFLLVALYGSVTSGAAVDLASLPVIKDAKDGSTVSVPKGTYSLASTLIVRYSLNLNGSVIISPLTGEPFLLNYPKADVSNFSTEKCATFAVTANAPNCTAHNVILGMATGTPAGSIGGGFEAVTGGTNFVVHNSTIGVTNEYPLYLQEDGMMAVDCVAYGSLHQATVRSDTPDGKKIPTGLMIVGGQYWHVALNCQTVEVRCGTITLTGGAIINGDIVTGQGTNGTPSFKPGDMGTTTFGTVTIQNVTAGNAALGVRWGSETFVSKSGVTFKSALPLSQLVVTAGGQTTWMK